MADTTTTPGRLRHHRRHRRLLAVAGSALLLATLSVEATARAAEHAPPKATYPVGVPDPKEPSGVAPPLATAMPGYARTYVTEFTGTALPRAWEKFQGEPQGAAGDDWLPSHVIVGGHLVRLLTYREGHRWVSGGMCLCALPHQTYGAYFVRSRITGPGPDENELLWPVAHVWPPEVDFNESEYSTNRTSWTVHYGTGSAFIQGTQTINLTRWHTFGVIWTPTELTFTVDGVVWGHTTAPAVIPHQPMTLDIDQEARCIPGYKWNACPTGEATMQINWVAVFTRQ